MTKYLSLFLFFSVGVAMSAPTESGVPSFDKKVKKFLQKLWEVEIVTEPMEIDSAENRFPDRYFYSIFQDEKLLAVLVINKAKGCRIGGCDGETSEEAGFEVFWYATVFNLDLTIKAVKVLEYDSEYGYEICAKRWLKQFQGVRGCNLRYGHEVDAISGATRSGESIVSDINNLCWLLDGIKLSSLQSRP